MKKHIAKILLFSIFFAQNTVKCQEQEDALMEQLEQKDIFINQQVENVDAFGLPLEARKQIAGMLNELLADEYILYTKTLKFHWNLTGEHFGALHNLFEKQYEKILKFIDTIAERSIQLGFQADGTLQEFLSKTSLTERAGESPDDVTMITRLLNDHEKIIQKLHTIITLAEQHGDHGTNNALSEIIEKHEKMAWMLRAHLQ